MLQQTHTISNKGLQSFAEASPDYEFAPVGLGSMHEQAKKLAEYGRNGDIYVVHAAEGETVIPLEVLNANPKIKELLFGQMRGMGLDPQEFVVGSELNSINPDTGLPEFFFKSVFRGVKKAVKSVAKIAKKAAPVVIPLAAAYFGIPFLGASFGAGTFGASFIGGGLGSLVGGASLKDSLKAGLMSGGIASLSAGAMGAFSKAPGSSFAGSLKSSFTGQTPVYALEGGKLVQQGTKYAASPFADVPGNLMEEMNLGYVASDADIASRAASDAQFGNIFGTGPNQNIMNTITGEGAPLGKTATDVYADQYTLKPGYDTLGRGEFYTDIFGREAQGFTPTGYDQFFAGTKLLDTGMSAPDPLPETTFLQDIFGTKNAAAISKFGDQVTDKLQPVTDFISPPMPTDSALDLKTKELMTQYPSTYKGITGADRAAAEAARILTPSLLEQYGPTAALALGGAKLGGAFDTPEVEDVTRADLPGFEGPTGYDLFQADPSAFKIADINPYRYDTGNPLVASAYAADGGYIEKPQNMNRGGTPQFPRREMLIEGPGTETSDDIPAMLSDGEFVMNAQAVRGADPSGNGNRQAGAKSLYDMMRNFEMRA